MIGTCLSAYRPGSRRAPSRFRKAAVDVSMSQISFARILAACGKEFRRFHRQRSPKKKYSLLPELISGGTWNRFSYRYVWSDRVTIQIKVEAVRWKWPWMCLKRRRPTAQLFSSAIAPVPGRRQAARFRHEQVRRRDEARRPRQIASAGYGVSL